MTSVANDISLALELADQADALTQSASAPSTCESTPSPTSPRSPMPTARVETAAVDLATERPDDSVLGEELGGTAAFTGRQWVIDPIDGTKNFVRGVPVWATLIALMLDGVPVVGVVSAPALGRRWWAGDGEGAFTSLAAAPRRISGPPVADLDSASLSFSSLTGWASAAGAVHRPHRRRVAGPRLRRFLVLLPGGRGCRRHRRRARGVPVGPRRARHPGARGGRRVHNLDGPPGPHGGGAVATNGLLHEAVLTRLNRG